MTGIDIRERAVGDTILIETDVGVLELVVVQPDAALVRVSGTDYRLHKPTIGRITFSESVVEPPDKRDGWIGPLRRVHIAFLNAIFISGVALSATVRGGRWYYDVF